MHSGFNQDRQQMTDRLLRAIENPHVDILGHPTGRRLLRREPYPFDIEAVVDAAAPPRRRARDQLPGRPARSERRACAAGARPRRALVISSDAHSRTAFGRLRWGVIVARRAWLEPEDVLNTRPFDEFRVAVLRRHRPMTQLKMLTADDKLAEIRRLYFKTTRRRSDEDFAKALDLLKSMASEEERERATVFMEGLAEMRQDWAKRDKRSGREQAGQRRPKTARAGLQAWRRRTARAPENGRCPLTAATAMRPAARGSGAADVGPAIGARDPADDAVHRRRQPTTPCAEARAHRPHASKCLPLCRHRACALRRSHVDGGGHHEWDDLPARTISQRGDGLRRAGRSGGDHRSQPPRPPHRRTDVR